MSQSGNRRRRIMDMTRAPRVWAVVATTAAALGIGLVSAGAVPMLPPSPAGASAPAGHDSATTAAAPVSHPTKRVCDRPTSPHKVACHSLERTDVTARKGVQPAVDPAGFGPATLQSAYALPSASAGAGQTVAIVDAFDDPNAEADLATYRTQFGLPACTTANGCFRKVDQRGGTTFPKPDASWAGEISLDVDMVSAICPNCHILLVEADDNNSDNLAIAVDEAVALGAKYVSNSYGGAESSEDISLDTHFHHPGVAITASTGDSGFGTQYPAASSFVTAVGGTSLRQDASARGWSETAWAGAGSGCSFFDDKPAWQTDTGCTRRTIGDVSADADPNTGVATYDTFQSGGWQVFGGTSVAAPIIASTYALAGPPAAGTETASYPYDSALTTSSDLNDITSGSNATTCNPLYICTAMPGYDGPTGLGTPHGVGAFVHRGQGTLAGTVTDAATGKPVPDAKIGIAGRAFTADDQGRYQLGLPAGDYHLTISAPGYQAHTADVTLTAGATLTHDVALTPLPHSAVSGTVTDGSGHGWPLYAKITATDTTPGSTDTLTGFTDPATGHYTLSLVNGRDYTLHIAPAAGTGYAPTDKSIHLATSDLTQDVALTAASACNAPGYRPTLTGPVQTFDSGKIPTGWKVTNSDPGLPGYSATPGWEFTDPGQRGNHTGGDGAFAIVDSDHSGQHNVQDTYLTSPTTDLTDAGTPAVQFDTDLQPAVNSTATVDLSTDNGTTWTTVWHQTGFPGQKGPARTTVELPQAAHQARVKIRFHYTGNWSKWWAIDDAFLGDRTCDPLTGALLTGRVTDTATQGGINGATITSTADPDQHTTTQATPGDQALGDGFYQLFTTSTGSQQFTATATGHNPATATTTLTPDHTTRLDIALTPTG